MTDYTKSTNFTSKDSLSTGNPLKIIKGAEFDTEFNSIATSIATKADLNSPAFIGTPTAPTAATSTNTTQLASTAFVVNYVTALFPAGSIILWSGSIASIPSGWALCDGQNSTPDLRGRFVMGAGSMEAVFTAISGAAATASISGTTMTVSAVSRGTVAAAQKVVGTGIPSDTVITALGTGTGGTGTYSVSYTGSASSFTGSIAGTELTVTALASGTIIVGQEISGTGITSGTTITAFRSGSGGTGTYTVSSSQTVASTTITGTGKVSSVAVTLTSTVLNVTAVTSGTLAVGQYLSGTGIPFGTKITSLGTGTGGTGTYNVDTDLSIGSTANISASAGTAVVGSSGGSKDSVVVGHTHDIYAVGDHAHFLASNETVAETDTLTATTSIAVNSNLNASQNVSYRLRPGTVEATIGLSSAEGGHTHAMSDAGVSGNSANLPPYYALAYIMKT